MKITLIILAFFAVTVAGMFAYNGYESNQIAKRDIELREKLTQLQLEQKELDKAKAEIEGGRMVTQEKKSVNKKSLQETTKETVSKDFEKQAKRLKERLK